MDEPAVNRLARARIITSILSKRLVDQLVVTVAPQFVGGLRAVRRVSQAAQAYGLLDRQPEDVLQVLLTYHE